MTDKILLTVRYEFENKEQYKEFYASHIMPRWMAEPNEKPEIRAIASYDLFDQLSKIEAAIQYDNSELAEKIEEIMGDI